MTAIPSPTRLQEVAVQPLEPARLEPLVGPARMRRFEQAAEVVRFALHGRPVVNCGAERLQIVRVVDEEPVLSVDRGCFAIRPRPSASVATHVRGRSTRFWGIVI